MRSLRVLILLVASVPVLAACSGADALQAEQLLQAANRAQSSISSETFSAHLSIEAKGQQMSLVLSGGGYAKGPRAGDMVMEMKISAPSLGAALPFDSIEIAKVGSSAWMTMGGKRVDLPAGSIASATGGNSDPLGAFDITKYVKDVRVDGGQILDGKSVTKITGVLDTASLVQRLASLGGASAAAGLPSLDGHVSDTRVVVYVDDQTHLLVAALADFSLHAGGETVTMHLDVAVTGVNQPVALPAA